MAKETSILQVRMSPRLKQQFEEICDADEISMSDRVREIIANLVRNRKRPSTRTDEEQPTNASKSASSAEKKTAAKKEKVV